MILIELYSTLSRCSMFRMPMAYDFLGLVAQCRRTRTLAWFAALQWSVNLVAV